MEAILAKVLEQFRARFTGKGLNTALRAVHRQESGRQRYRPKLLRLTEERSPVLTCFLDACSSTSFLRPRSGWLERKPRKKAELWGTNWSQMAPPTPEPLTLSSVTPLGRFYDFTITAFGRLGVKDIQTCPTSTARRISCRESKPTTSFRICLVLFSKLDGLMNSLIFILMWLEDQCRIICLYTQKKTFSLLNAN